MNARERAERAYRALWVENGTQSEEAVIAGIAKAIEAAEEELCARVRGALEPVGLAPQVIPRPVFPRGEVDDVSCGRGGCPAKNTLRAIQRAALDEPRWTLVAGRWYCPRHTP